MRVRAGIVEPVTDELEFACRLVALPEEAGEFLPGARHISLGLLADPVRQPLRLQEQAAGGLRGPHGH